MPVPASATSPPTRAAHFRSRKSGVHGHGRLLVGEQHPVAHTLRKFSPRRIVSWPSVTRMSRRFCPCQADGHAARYRRNAPCRRSDARRSALPLQRDSRWKTFNGIHIRHANLIKQSARIWCDGFEIPSLCLNEQSPEGKRRFSRAGHAGKHDERISRKVKIHVLKIMFAGAADGDEARSTRHLRHALTARE